MRSGREPGERIRALIDISRLETGYLQKTDRRLFPSPLTPAQVETLPKDDDYAERVDAFVARFGRLQDTIGDKLLPAFLSYMQETPGTAVENLDRAERLGLVQSADRWFTIRKLRNRMIHEYVKSAEELADALNAAHEFVPELQSALDAVIDRIRQHDPGLVPR